MRHTAIEKKPQWLLVLLLLVAALAGWALSAWLTRTPAPPVPGEGPGLAQQPVASSPQAAAPSSSPLDELMAKQASLTEALQAIASERARGQASESSQTPLPSAVPPSPASAEARPQVRSEDIERQRAAILASQRVALDELRRMAPGDTAGMIAAMRKFDREMQAAGAPSLINMSEFEKAMKAAARMQEIGLALAAESKKGRDIDTDRIQRLTNEMVVLQNSMPTQFINEEVLRRSMAP
jgi:hypothetical protein